MDYMQILVEHDHPSSWMEAPDFDEELAERRFGDFVRDLSETLKLFVRTETGELLQDAIYHSEAFLPVGEYPQPSIRFSRFDALATLFLIEKVPEGWKSTIENLLSKHGYIYVPADVLAQPYTGSN